MSCYMPEISGRKGRKRTDQKLNAERSIVTTASVQSREHQEIQKETWQMIIQCDTRQQMGKKHHKIKEQWFLDNGHEVVHSKCLVGDYICPSNGSVSVDTKQNCTELYNDLISDHKRFSAECQNAQKYGIQLYVLVENTEGFKEPRDIINWKNPQMFRYWKAKKKGSTQKPPASNVQLIKIMHTMNKKYGVIFEFCKTEDAGQRIVEILTGKENADE